MKVNLIKPPIISYKINITRKESNQVAQLFTQYHAGKTEGILEQLKGIFEPHIERKFKSTKTERGYSKKDYLQELYLTLFESFIKPPDNNHTVSGIVQKLNKTVPKKNEYITLPKHIPVEKIIDTDLQKYYAQLVFTSETKRGWAKKIVGTSHLSQRAIDILGRHIEGEKYSDLAEKYDLSPQRVSDIYNKTILTIRLNHNKEFRDKYFEKYPRARNWLKMVNCKPSCSAEKLFESHKSDKEQKIIKEVTEKPKKIKKDKNIKVKTYPQKETTIKSDKTWTVEDICDSNIQVENDAIFKQTGIVTGDVTNHGLYILKGITKGNIKNSGKLNLRGIVNGKIENKGEINLSGITNNISNDGKMNISGAVLGDIINYGDLQISGFVKGNIYTYNEINISDNAEIFGKIFKLDDV